MGFGSGRAEVLGTCPPAPDLPSWQRAAGGARLPERKGEWSSASSIYGVYEPLTDG